MTRAATIVLLACLISLGTLVTDALAQCCATACVDADGSGADDDAVRCESIVTERIEALAGGRIALAGCQEVEGVACAGGRVDVAPPVGCVCASGTCEGGADPLEPSACTERAAGACRDAGAAVTSIDDDFCGGDQDCSSVVDRPVEGSDCGTDVGTCRKGTWACGGPSYVCASEVGPEDEICDGLDNDCNGVTDDACSYAPCNSNADCPNGGFCVNCDGSCAENGGQCFPSCAFNECGPEATCVIFPGRAMCLRTCITDDDCPELQTCSMGSTCSPVHGF